jgi:DNA topoisomerase VI subunit B
MTALWQRTAFASKRTMEFFTEKELAMQIGHDMKLWPLALVKELIDNALDACEQAGIAPIIKIVVRKDSVSIEDNGPGLPRTTLEKALDYSVFVSDKSRYVGPTRGQLGNALKCVSAAPLVADGERGRIEVVTGGERHDIDVTLDRIAQEPRIERRSEPANVHSGTSVTMHWRGIASYLGCAPNVNLYIADDGDEDDGWEDEGTYRHVESLHTLVSAYAAFNPHATFILDSKDAAVPWASFPAGVPGWTKWVPPYTCPHWYTDDKLRDLIAAHLTQQLSFGARPRTVQQLISEFAGFKRSDKQTSVAGAVGLSGALLSDLMVDDDIDLAAVNRLRSAMQAATRPVKPSALGVLGRDHVTAILKRDYEVDPESVRYKSWPPRGWGGPIPFVLEVALGMKADHSASRTILAGVNWSPALSPPFAELFSHLADNRVDACDPVVVLAHLAIPCPKFSDRGKAHLDLPVEILDGLESCVNHVAKKLKEAKRQTDRSNRLSERQLEALEKANRRRQVTVKAAAWDVMAQAYMDASDDGRLPAHARQIMYSARPQVLDLTDGRCWSKSAYFTQHLLPDFIEAHPEVTKTWDVVFDARGHLVEPHTGRRIDLGTVGVREYVSSWRGDVAKEPGVTFASAQPTRGPAHRYRFVLFVEKEGFGPLIERADFAGRYDLAIMSTKGMSVTAARQLAERFAEENVTILVLHDFDTWGFSILHTLRNDTRRFRFKTKPSVIDLGLRLRDVEAMQLQDEEVVYRGKKDPRERLRQNRDVTDEECAFLVGGRRGSHWVGRRVELNAMTSPVFIECLERKLDEHGVSKLVPRHDVLDQAYRRAVTTAILEAEMSRQMAAALEDATRLGLPNRLAAEVKRRLKRQPSKSWDQVIAEIAHEHVSVKR